VPADEVCGCPLVRDVFELTGDFCRVPKRKCHRHYCWEKLRRAEVDLERVRVVGAAPRRGSPGWGQALLGVTEGPLGGVEVLRVVLRSSGDHQRSLGWP